MDTSLGTVKSRLTRGRRALKERLEPFFAIRLAVSQCRSGAIGEAVRSRDRGYAEFSDAQQSKKYGDVYVQMSDGMTEFLTTSRLESSQKNAQIASWVSNAH